jgi:hypothetical protein
MSDRSGAATPRQMPRLHERALISETIGDHALTIYCLDSLKAGHSSLLVTVS